MPNNVKYVSTDGLTEFLTKLTYGYEHNTSSSNTFKVNYAAEAGKATNDAVGQNINQTYISVIDFKGSGESSYTPLTKTQISNGGQKVEIDLSGYALKSEVSAALHFRDVVATEADLPSTDVAVGDVYIVTTDSAGQSSTEFVCTDTSPLTWEKLGPTVDYTTFVTKKTSATSGNLVQFTTGGDILDSNIAASSIGAGTIGATGTGHNDETVKGSTVHSYIIDPANHIVNTIESVSVNGTALTPSSYGVDIDLSAYTYDTIQPQPQSGTDNSQEPVSSRAVIAYVGDTANVTKVFDDSATPAHVDNLYEATSTEIDGLFTGKN